MNHRVETVVLDSQGLSAWISQDRAVLAMIRSFHSMAAELVVCADTIVEVMRTRVNTARLNPVLSQVKVEAVTEQAARAAAGLREEAGPHGHKYAIDAIVTELALRRPGPVAMLTSDVDDMTKLCGNHVRLIAI